MEKEYRVNEKIKSPQVRVIDEEGQQLGILDIEKALEIARDRGYDLVEIAPNADPPVCKIIDFGKFKYQLNKKSQEAKKKQTVIQVKEIKLRPKTDVHDIDVKVNHIKRFIEDKNKVKITVVYRGRELAHQEIGFKVMEEVMNKINDIVKVETPPKLEGRNLYAIVAPKSSK
ncbi:MAG: translation initiation factor IF-3 [Proteobacteria bacterium]|nr:translation initiation factor IF-3 [Pseudomonadota bacterium]